MCIGEERGVGERFLYLSIYSRVKTRGQDLPDYKAAFAPISTNSPFAQVIVGAAKAAAHTSDHGRL